MAFDPATLTGHFEKQNGDPASGTVEIIPNSKVIVDQAANVVLAGRLKVTLDDTGGFSVDLPPTNDADLEPATGRQYTIAVRLHHSNDVPTLKGIELDGGTTTDFADLVSGVETAAVISTFLTEELWDSFVTDVASKETPTGAQAKADAAQAAAATYTDTSITTLKGGADAAWDTLQELHALMATDETAATALTTLVGNLRNLSDSAFSTALATAYPRRIETFGLTLNADGSVATETIGGQTTTYTYNGDGSLHTATRNGVTITYAYDGSGNLTGAV